MLVGAADVVFLYLVSVVFMIIYIVLKILLRSFRPAEKFLKKKLRSFKYGVYLELFEASFLFLLIATVINFSQLNSDNVVEGIQSILCVLLISFLIVTPLIYIWFVSKTFQRYQPWKKQRTSLKMGQALGRNRHNSI